MRKCFTLLLAFTMLANTSEAAFTEAKVAGKQNSNTAMQAAQQKAAAEFFVKLSRKEYEQLTGRHLSFVERLAFKMAQKSTKHQLKRAEEETEGFNLGGFALGFFLSIVGVLLAYLFSQDANFRRWAWWGFRVSLFIASVVVLILALKGS